MTAKKPATQYPESIRNFALTLHSLSPRGYGYVRKKFNKNLPHPSTIRAWFSNSHANGTPGISKESIETPTNLVNEYRAKNMELYCTLSMDEVSIRRHIQWSDTEKKFKGHKLLTIPREGCVDSCSTTCTYRLKNSCFGLRRFDKQLHSMCIAGRWFQYIQKISSIHH